MFDSIVRIARLGFSRVAIISALVLSVVIAGPASPSQADATGSVYFPNNSYATMAPGISFGGQTAPFTIEAWFKTDYSDVNGDGIVILGSAPNAGSSAGFKGLSFFAIPGNFREWRLDSDGFASTTFYFSQGLSENTWHYIVATRDSSGYVQMWIDGVANVTGRISPSSAFDFTGPTTRVGAWTNNNRYNQGTYISNLRITNTNLFATNLSTVSIPTAPFTVVPGTRLLMNSGSVTDASGIQTFTTTGSVAASSQNPFFGVATVTGISPSSGPTQGGTLVTISGTNLSNATVTVGGVAATIVSTTATSIDILTPAGSVGSQSVVVTGAAGTPTTTYTYQVINLPGAPTAVSATSGGTLSSVVTWTAPGSTGGSAITEYQVLSSGGQTCTSATSSCTMTGLSAGTSYTFTVRARNILGYGSYSSASAAVSTASDGALASTGNQGTRSLLLGITSLMLIALGANLIGLRLVKLSQQ